MDPELARYLAPGPTVESAHPAVLDFARAHTPPRADPVNAAVALYYAVRDGIRYDPYAAVLTTDGLRASGVLAAGRAWCVPKAVLLAAACRSQGIPARLGFADVRNHLSTARLREQMQSEVFYWHGYTSIHLDGRWVKATPAFNVGLCAKFGLLPLEFDGRRDSLYHPFDRAGKRHMEYLHSRGEYAEVPLEAMRATFREKYPRMYGALTASPLGDADFGRDVEQESAADAGAVAGSAMSPAELHDLALRFTDAFNRDDLDSVMSFFTSDAVYDEFNGRQSHGCAEIRAALLPQFRGAFGKIRFHEEDLFVDASAGKVLVRWTCTLEREGRTRRWRGLDILHLRDGRVSHKLTYAKSEKPLLESQDSKR